MNHLSRRARTLLAAPVSILMLTSVAAASAPFPSSVPVPDDFGPEGVAVGVGSTFYVTSIPTGDIYRGDLRSGAGEILVDAPDGRLAAGLKVDERHHRLVVAGGTTGQVNIYDSRTGAEVTTYQVAAPGTALLNDVVLTRRAAYVTDSFNPVLYKIELGPGGRLGDAETIELTGPAAVTVQFPNLNGIAATPDGSTLIIGHSQLGAVFTVDPETGHSTPIEVAPGAITPGVADGLLLDGRTLWLVENFANRVLGIELAPDLTTGTVTTVITNAEADGLLRVPTTIAEHGNRLVLINARYDLGLPPPFGPGAPPGTEFDVVMLEKR